MKKLVFALFSIVPLLGIAQPGNPLSQSVSGGLAIPVLQNLEVINMNTDELAFKNAADYNGAKAIPSYYKVIVKSNTPWEVSVATGTSTFIVNDGIAEMPAGIISIKNSAESNYVSLGKDPVTVLQSTNNNITNTYNLDLKLNPSWDYPGGVYNISLTFSISEL